jgi:MPBQ/MSBQ methyltransferase
VSGAFRVLRPSGVGVVVGPVRPAGRLARALADLWMLFPAVEQYREWFERAGFEDVRVSAVAPAWYRGPTPYAVAVAGTKPAPGPSPLALPEPVERVDAPLSPRERLRFAARFALGSLAGFAFVPLGAVLALRARLGRAGPGGP